MSGEVDDCDAGASEADVFVMVGGDVGVDSELCADESLQDTVACTVEDADLTCGELDCVVKEVRDGLYGFVGSHATHVDLILEVELTTATVLRSLT